MTNCIYLATVEPHCGKSLISLGLTEFLLRKTKRVGLFRPVINPVTPQHRDKNIDLLLSHFDLKLEYEDCYAFLKREVNQLAAQGRYDEILNRIIQKYKALEARCDFILCIGSDFVGEGAAFEFDFNADVAKNLACPVLILGHAADRDVETAVSAVQMAVESFLEKECQILGTIINRADPEKIPELLLAMREKLPKAEEQVLSVVPANKVLDSPTLKEIARHLEAEVLYGEDQLEKQAYLYLVIAMQVQNYLLHLKENALLITPGDRGDVILSALQAHQSHNYPQISGIVLTTGLKPAPSVMRLLDGLPSLVPIISVNTDTYETAAKTASIQPYLTPDNQAKIALSLKLFEEHVDTKALEARLSTVQVRGITPRMFRYNLVQKAKANKQHIVLPESTDERILKATEILVDQDIVDITLLGDVEEVKSLIQRLGRRIDLNKVSIIDPEKSPKFFDYIETLYDLRKNKGMTLDAARELMIDISYYGTMMVYKGDADAMVSGAAHTTQHTIRPALQFVKTKPGFTTVSSVFFMCLDERVLVYGDCAVNPNPTAEQLAEIAISSAATSQAFGIEPKVAMLSYSSGESGLGEDVERVRQATLLAREKRPDLKIEGPIQYDAAVDPDVAAKKVPNSEVAGHATVLIFPDLNTGNNTYKAVQRETGAIAIGPILQGLNKPVNDLSRGCTVEDIINTVVITAIQAQTA
jgi:phosphate acetyltransferase